MNCAVCDLRPVEMGHLCEDCREEIAGPPGLVPEQILATSAKPTGAVLIDPWGRPHPLDARTLIGRQLEGAGVCVLEGSVSRHHAHLSYDPVKKSWSLRDLGSVNGTLINDHELHEASTTLRAGDRIHVGQVGFYFLPDGANLPPVTLDPAAANTLRPSDRVAAPPSPGLTQVEAAEFDSENTDVGLPHLTMRLNEPTGGGGGLVEIDGKHVQLTTTQFEFFALLVRRMASEETQPHLVRGFVRTSELIGDLSWDTREPGDNHVKQLVRRVRRALVKAEVGDLIESRHRFGYRLRVVPHLES
ncbi:MAG: FHA domain-containing protein [Kofleriaceae bacterium]|nr:MAG: FHA domain-containing protein [Kofleriaceae bacterium]MBZ0235213.1 FHA domain-containing protein [Kofleriaceae bacterium]